jgi:hypothetical protein
VPAMMRNEANVIFILFLKLAFIFYVNIYAVNGNFAELTIAATLSNYY